MMAGLETRQRRLAIFRICLGTAQIMAAQADFLVKRWNNPNSQANIYVYSGFGGAKFQSQKGYAGQVGVEADAESRSWFIMGKYETMWSNVAHFLPRGV